MNQFRSAEQALTKLDITRAETDRSVFGACEGKMMWMVERLEAKYGTDFMPRFLEICRALKGRESPSTQEVLYFFSLTAGEDLTPTFHDLGIEVVPPAAVPREELQRKLEALRGTPARANR